MMYMLKCLVMSAMVMFRGVGFGPTPSMHPAKSTLAIAKVRSQERDVEVTQWKNQVAFFFYRESESL